MQEQADEFNASINAEFEALKSAIIEIKPGSLPDFAVDVEPHYRSIHEIIHYAGEKHEKVNIVTLNNALQNLILYFQNIRGAAAPDIGDFTDKSVDLIKKLQQRFLDLEPDAVDASVRVAPVAPLAVEPIVAAGPGVVATPVAADPPLAGPGIVAAPVVVDPPLAAPGIVAAPDVVDPPLAPPAPPAPPVVVADPAVDRLPNDDFHKAIKSSVASFNTANPATKAKIEPLEVLPNHDIHCKIKYPEATNIKPIIFKRKQGEHLSLTSESPTIETRKEQARLLKDLPPKGPKTLKLAADTPAGFKELWKAMREADHHITGLSHEQQELLTADATLAHLIERAGPSIS